MSDINVIVISGRLGADPELIEVGSTTKTNLRLGSSRKYTTKSEETKEETCWIDVVTWGKLSELTKKYCEKGQEVTVTGRLVQENWKDKEGNARYAHRLHAEDVKFGNKAGARAIPAAEAATGVPVERVRELFSAMGNLLDSGIKPDVAIKTLLSSLDP
jgi:single-strand DNA-binding protein